MSIDLDIEQNFKLLLAQVISNADNMSGTMSGLCFGDINLNL